MGDVIGDLLPLALGIAISPIPIIAAILMLLSPKARTTSVGFLLGWIIGIVVAVVAFTLLSSILPEDDPDASKPIQGIIQLGLGGLLLLMSATAARSRPANPQPLRFRRDLHDLEPVEFALGHRAELAEDGVLVLGDALVNDPSQLEGDRTGLAHGQVVQSGLFGRGDRDPVHLSVGVLGHTHRERFPGVHCEVGVVVTEPKQDVVPAQDIAR
jgi:hypothetical protein